MHVVIPRVPIKNARVIAESQKTKIDIKIILLTQRRQARKNRWNKREVGQIEQNSTWHTKSKHINKYIKMQRIKYSN